MGPKRGKGGAKALPIRSLPQVDHADLKQAQSAYQQYCSKSAKKLVAGIEQLREKDTHMSRIAALRLLADKHDDLKNHFAAEKAANGQDRFAPWLYRQLKGFKPEYDQPFKDGRMSCTLASALVACWRQYVDLPGEINDDDRLRILGLFSSSFQKGFHKEQWSKEWLDPKQETLHSEAVKGCFVQEQVTAVGMLAAQIKLLVFTYPRLYRSNAFKDSPLLGQYYDPEDVMKATWQQEAASVAAASERDTKAASAAAGSEGKQLDPRLVQQQALWEERLQQQQSGSRSRGRDTERHERDIKRSETTEAEDRAHEAELRAAREAEEKIAENANQVWRYLCNKLLDGKQVSKEQHLEELSKLTIVAVDQVKAVLNDMKKDAKDKPEAAALLKQCLAQFGDTMPSDAALADQLNGLRKNLGYLFVDEAASDSKQQQQQQHTHTWSSFDAFEQHVCSTHLSVSDDSDLPYHEDAPDLNAVYRWELDAQLADTAGHLQNGRGKHLANGWSQDDAWLDALGDECPMARFLQSYRNAIHEDSFQLNKADPQALVRLANATGFALLQLQRELVSPDPQFLSQQEDWVLLAFHTLRMRQAHVLGCEILLEDYLVYHFWTSKQACAKEYERIVTPSREVFPDSTDESVSDCVMMLQMLQEGQVLQGPLLRAVQLYLQRHAGVQLDLMQLPSGMQADKALNKLSLDKQEELRLYLFQVLDCVCLSLPKYKEFLRQIQELHMLPLNAPVQATANKQKAGASLCLWPKFYEQACLSAAQPPDYSSPCCNKHVVIRRAEEQQGRCFSRFAADTPYDRFTCDTSLIEQEDGSVIQRYLVQPLQQSVQAAQQQDMFVATPNGLKALVYELYGVNQHHYQVRLGAPDEASEVLQRSSWDKVRTDLVIAQQLAMHRQQLAKLIEEQRRIVEKKQYRLGKNEADGLLRALFTQRVAGRQWMLYHFQQLVEGQREQLIKQEEDIKKQVEKIGSTSDRAGKASKEQSKEREKELQDKLDKIRVKVGELNNHLSAIKSHLMDNNTEAQSYPDLIRVNNHSKTNQNNNNWMIHVLIRELAGNAETDSDAVEQLKDAWRLARLMLFDLDTEIMQHIMQARSRVLNSAWKHKQLPVVVLLAAEVIKSNLLSLTRSAEDKELFEWAEKEAQAKQQSQQQPAAKKKKKKKGPAAKPAAAIKVVEEEDEQDEADEQHDAAAVANDASAMQQSEESQHQAGIDVEGDDVIVEDEDGMIDIALLARNRQSSTDDSRNNKKAQAAVAAKRSSSTAAQEASHAADISSSGSNYSRQPPTAVSAQQNMYATYGPPYICGHCGDIGHKAEHCRTAYCARCNQWGHDEMSCQYACQRCGRIHHQQSSGYGRACSLKQCRKCGLWGHVSSECPNNRCSKCGFLGHRHSECREKIATCRDCGLPRYSKHECKQSATTAEAAQPAAAAASEAAAGSTGGGSGGSRVQQQQQGRSASASATTSAVMKPSKPPSFSPGCVKLETAREERIMQLMNELYERGENEYASSLFEAEKKKAVFARISDSDFDAMLQQPKLETALEAIYTHYQKTKTGGRFGEGRVSELHPAAAAAMEAELQQQYPGLLPPNWRSMMWVELDRKRLRYSSDKATAAAQRKAFYAAKERAVADSLRAEQQRHAEQQQQQRQGEQPQPSTPQRSREVNARGLKPSSSRVSADGGSSQQQRQDQRSDHSQADTGSSSAAAATALTAGPASPAVRTRPTAGMSSSQASASEQRQQQREVGFQAPHPLYTKPAAVTAEPAADSWGAQQASSSSSSSAAAAPLPIVQGDLQPWMLQYREGVMRAMHELIVDEQVRAQLQALVDATPEEQLAAALVKQLKGILRSVGREARGSNNLEGLLMFADLVDKAAKIPQSQQQTRSAAATAASELNLLPALEHSQPQQQPPQQQQQQLQPPLPLPQQSASGRVQPSASVVQQLLPPHLQQLQHQQAQPPAAAAAADGADDSDEDDNLLAILSGGATDPQQQQQPPRSWGSAEQQQQQLLPSSEFPSLGASAPGSRTAPAVSSAGLANETGEYNCFLNVVVQCLYSCKAFREQVRDMPSYQQGNPVVHALLQLFKQMQAAEQGWRPGQDRVVVNPTELREALDAATQFRRQEMNDANELIDTLFECFKAAQGGSSDPGSRGVLIDSVFGLKVNERVRCTNPECGIISHVVPSHWEHLLVVYSMALGYAAQDAQNEHSSVEMGLVLRALFDQEFKACDKDVKGCGANYPPERQCEQSPRVLILQLVWSPDVTGRDIGDALQYVQEVVDIKPIYAADVLTSDTTYQLSSAVAYYGQHYMAFVRNEKLNQWLMFDDATVSLVGSWEDVKKKCVNGRIQPSVLFYQVADVPSTAAAAAASGAVQQQQQQPMQVPYSSRQPVAAVAAGGNANVVHWAAGGMPMQVRPLQQQQLPYPAAAYAAAGGAPAHVAQLNAAAAGPPPPAAAAAVYRTSSGHSFKPSGPHSGSSNGNMAAAAAIASAVSDSWGGYSSSPAGTGNAWGPAATDTTAEVVPASRPTAAAAGSSVPMRNPGWSSVGPGGRGAAALAQQALGGIADQARSGPTAAAAAAGGGGSGRGMRGPAGRGVPR